MKILFMTGNHPRHRFLAQKLHATGMLSALVIENREAFVPEAPAGLSPRLKDLWRIHFDGRSRSEQTHFDEAPSGQVDIPTLEVSREEINGVGVSDFIMKTSPDLLLSYGVHKLTDRTLNSAQGLRWNIHGGLSPWYRGVATHFWPSYLLEPQMTGMTVHELTQQIDGGDIVHQCVAPLVPGDGLHDLACRAVIALGSEFGPLVDIVAAGNTSRPVAQRTTGRVWRAEDWRPEHLIPIYEQFGNAIVDHYLSGSYTAFAPNLVRQFTDTTKPQSPS